MDASTYKKRLQLARLLLVLAIPAAILAWFLDWEMVTATWPSLPMIPRSTQMVFRAAVFGIIPDSYHGPLPIEMMLLRYSVLLLFVATAVVAPLLVSWLARANPLRWLWILVDAGAVVGLTVGYRKVSDYFFITGWTVEPLPEIHVYFLPGFYLACLAGFLHFTGLLLIPSAKSLDRPALPESE
jgi:hypothetical protein